ncbi:MAG: hypothetical protein GX075_03815 [Firmicutes bacterium]|nr:hypothetical protein [Bacillota bacterium]
MNRLLFISFFLIIGISLLAGCGGGSGGGNIQPPTTQPPSTILEQINQLLDNFETAHKTTDISLFKSCVTDPFTFYDDTLYHKDFPTEMDTCITFKYANRQIQIINPNKVTVTAVSVYKEDDNDYIESYDKELLEIVKDNDQWKITKISGLPVTPDPQKEAELNQLFDSIEEGMLFEKDLNKVSNCVEYPFSQYDRDNGHEDIFHSQQDLQNYLKDLTYEIFDIEINDYYYIGPIDSEYIAIIRIRTTQEGKYQDDRNHFSYNIPSVLLKKVNNQWKIYKIDGILFY